MGRAVSTSAGRRGGLPLVWPQWDRGAGVVFLRNFLAWRKYYRSSLLLNFGEPLAGLLALGFGLGSFLPTMAGVPFVAYIGPGLLAVTAMNAVSFDMGWEAYARLNENGVYHALIAAPLTVGQIVGGELLWEMFRAVVYGGVFLLVLAALGLVHSWWALAVPLPLACLGLVFGAPSLWVGALARTQEQLFFYYSLVITPLFLFSGVFFPLSALPAWAARVVQVTPLYHAVHLIRGLVLGHLGSAMEADALWLLAYAAGLAGVPGAALRRRLIL